EESTGGALDLRWTERHGVGLEAGVGVESGSGFTELRMGLGTHLYFGGMMAGHPEQRPRRLRGSEALAGLTGGTILRPADLRLPLFVLPGQGVRRPVASMPGVDQTSPDELLRDAEEALGLGIPAVLLFGIPDEKDEVGSSGYRSTGVVQEAVRLLK